MFDRKCNCKKEIEEINDRIGTFNIKCEVRAEVGAYVSRYMHENLNYFVKTIIKEINEYQVKK